MVIDINACEKVFELLLWILFLSYRVDIRN